MKPNKCFVVVKECGNGCPFYDEEAGMYNDPFCLHPESLGEVDFEGHVGLYIDEPIRPLPEECPFRKNPKVIIVYQSLG